MGELLHLSLQKAGFHGSHQFVNEVIAPGATKTGKNLADVVDEYIKTKQIGANDLKKAWSKVPNKIKHLVEHPEKYIGDAVVITKREAKNKL